MPIETITGSLDGNVIEDIALSAEGTCVLESSSDTLFFKLEVDGIYGLFSITPTGKWAYLLDNELKSVQSLGATSVSHDYFLVRSVSGEQATIDIVVRGSNDIASFSGNLQKSLDAKTEEKVSGRVLISDQDLGEKEIQSPGTFQGTHGSLKIDKDGEWTYTLSGAERISILDKGKDVSDKVILSSLDGTQFSIEIQIFASSILAINQMQGTNGPDYLLGSSSIDLILGLGGDDTLIGGLGDDTLNGGTGIDTAKFTGARDNYIISSNKTTFTVSDKTTNRDGSDSLIGVERLKFSDKTVAIDLDGNAGITAKIIGAVFGKAALTNPTYVGIGLSYLDRNVSYSDLGAEALRAVGANTPEAIVSLLWLNIIGVPATSANKTPYIKMLADGMMPGDLVVLAADTDYNTNNIGLVGLMQTGIEYTLG